MPNCYDRAALSQYLQDNYDPDDSFCTVCVNPLDDCVCPEEIDAQIQIPCSVCGEKFFTFDDGQMTNTICPGCSGSTGESEILF